MWFTFTIPWRTVIKKNARTIGRNKKTGQLFPVKSKELKEYEENTILVLQSQLNKQGLGKPFFTQPVKARFTFYFSGTCNCDFDNLLGAPADCAQKAGILQNDKLIKKAEVEILENTGVDKAVLQFAFADSPRHPVE
jgi:Holliday junction resolvase RusA-like endonuclease